MEEEQQQKSQIKIKKSVGVLFVCFISASVFDIFFCCNFFSAQDKSILAFITQLFYCVVVVGIAVCLMGSVAQGKLCVAMISTFFLFYITR